jgi:uncharacterized protein (DUF362 family)/ferredoxin
MSKVLILNADYDGAKEAVDEVFREFPLDVAGKRVFIKPNLVIGKPPQEAATTHPALVRAIVDACRERNAKQVLVGDNPGGGEHLVRATAEEAGFLPLLEDCFKDVSGDSRTVSVNSPLSSSVSVSADILNADVLINVPKFKTHPMVGLTGCIKNMFGAVPGLEKARMHTLTGKMHEMMHFFVKLYDAVTPHLNIVDAVLAMEGEGPSHGRPRRLGKIIAGDNGAEVDVVMGAMLGLPTERMRFFKTIAQEGLGSNSLKDITLMGEFERIKDFTLPTINTLSGDDLKLLFTHHGQLKPVLDEDACTHCGRCIDVCFTRALEMQDYPLIDYDKCIACWCCYEMCPEGAYSLPDAVRIVERIKAEVSST